MKHFFYRLNSPRPSFPADITPSEIALMRSHVAYWSSQMAEGRVLAFGPVDDPRGSYGIGIIQLQDDVDPQMLGDNDPAIEAHVGFSFEIHSMPRLVLPPQRT
jgi:uncharacterized protein YciI